MTVTSYGNNTYIQEILLFMHNNTLIQTLNHAFDYLCSCNRGCFYKLLLGNVRVVSYLINQALCHINKAPEK